MVKEWMDFIAAQDPEAGAAIQAEYDRQRRHIELIASENFVSPAVLAAAAPRLTSGRRMGRASAAAISCTA